MLEQSPEEPDDPAEAADPDDPIPEQYREPSTADLEPDLADVEVPDELARRFWGLVATVNVGLLAAAVGLLVLVFEADWRRGGAAFVLGVLTLGYAYYKYRRYTADRQG
ncbi:MAG: hypothetical protein ABEJ06_00145 [Haloarculaceae archaeon]